MFDGLWLSHQELDVVKEESDVKEQRLQEIQKTMEELNEVPLFLSYYVISRIQLTLDRAPTRAREGTGQRQP